MLLGIYKFLTPAPWITKNYSSFTVRDHIKAQKNIGIQFKPRKKSVGLKFLRIKLITKLFLVGKNIQRKSDHHGKDIWKKLKKIYKGIYDHLKISSDKIYHVEHHKCHAAYAYWGSPFRKKCLILRGCIWRRS